MLFNEFFIVFAQSLVIDVNKLFKLVYGILLFAWPREPLQDLFQPLFGMREKLECLNKLKVDV
jgi:hypothetical protein